MRIVHTRNKSFKSLGLLYDSAPMWSGCHIWGASGTGSPRPPFDPSPLTGKHPSCPADASLQAVRADGRDLVDHDTTDLVETVPGARGERYMKQWGIGRIIRSTHRP